MKRNRVTVIVATLLGLFIVATPGSTRAVAPNVLHSERVQAAREAVAAHLSHIFAHRIDARLISKELVQLGRHTETISEFISNTADQRPTQVLQNQLSNLYTPVLFLPVKSSQQKDRIALSDRLTAFTDQLKKNNALDIEIKKALSVLIVYFQSHAGVLKKSFWQKHKWKVILGGSALAAALGGLWMLSRRKKDAALTPTLAPSSPQPQTQPAPEEPETPVTQSTLAAQAAQEEAARKAQAAAEAQRQADAAAAQADADATNERAREAAEKAKQEAEAAALAAEQARIRAEQESDGSRSDTGSTTSTPDADQSPVGSSDSEKDEPVIDSEHSDAVHSGTSDASGDEEEATITRDSFTLEGRNIHQIVFTILNIDKPREETQSGGIAITEEHKRRIIEALNAYKDAKGKTYDENFTALANLVRDLSDESIIRLAPLLRAYDQCEGSAYLEQTEEQKSATNDFVEAFINEMPSATEAAKISIAYLAALKEYGQGKEKTILIASLTPMHEDGQALKREFDDAVKRYKAEHPEASLQDAYEAVIAPTRDVANRKKSDERIYRHSEYLAKALNIEADRSHGYDSYDIPEHRVTRIKEGRDRLVANGATYEDAEKIAIQIENDGYKDYQTLKSIYDIKRKNDWSTDGPPAFPEELVNAMNEAAENARQSGSNGEAQERARLQAIKDHIESYNADQARQRSERDTAHIIKSMTARPSEGVTRNATVEDAHAEYYPEVLRQEAARIKEERSISEPEAIGIISEENDNFTLFLDVAAPREVLDQEYSYDGEYLPSKLGTRNYSVYGNQPQSAADLVALRALIRKEYQSLVSEFSSGRRGIGSSPQKRACQYKQLEMFIRKRIKKEGVDWIALQKLAPTSGDILPFMRTKDLFDITKRYDKPKFDHNPADISKIKEKLTEELDLNTLAERRRKEAEEEVSHFYADNSEMIESDLAKLFRSNYYFEDIEKVSITRLQLEVGFSSDRRYPRWDGLTEKLFDKMATQRAQEIMREGIPKAEQYITENIEAIKEKLLAAITPILHQTAGKKWDNYIINTGQTGAKGDIEKTLSGLTLEYFADVNGFADLSEMEQALFMMKIRDKSRTFTADSFFREDWFISFADAERKKSQADIEYQDISEKYEEQVARDNERTAPIKEQIEALKAEAGDFPVGATTEVKTEYLINAANRAGVTIPANTPSRRVGEIVRDKKALSHLASQLRINIQVVELRKLLRPNYSVRKRSRSFRLSRWEEILTACNNLLINLGDLSEDLVNRRYRIRREAQQKALKNAGANADYDHGAVDRLQRQIDQLKKFHTWKLYDLYDGMVKIMQNKGKQVSSRDKNKALDARSVNKVYKFAARLTHPDAKGGGDIELFRTWNSFNEYTDKDLKKYHKNGDSSSTNSKEKYGRVNKKHTENKIQKLTAQIERIKAERHLSQADINKNPIFSMRLKTNQQVLLAFIREKKMRSESAGGGSAGAAATGAGGAAAGSRHRRK